ncbi:N-acetylmuramoyl-L-alanine amidase [Paenibacillus sp. YN15]|uniref:peptidoglycan recognition protein family protein n=1 Tax=Paenibacillus sp. YN15 TaxID=1742774 RepID=UPI000DCC1395|nr:N-acetylmuramoyl-L-alanine amidase [Paenibacillus sp. YN15]RAV03622.1 hypothetical protein DQG13_07960 [Paenibacillus sp. YN15]
MNAAGIIVHHSACSAINGKGYDYMIMKNGSIIPATAPTDPNYIHICLEGDFSQPAAAWSKETAEQMFLLVKLALRLSGLLHFTMKDIYSHSEECPGSFFPWSMLVISEKDGYH